MQTLRPKPPTEQAADAVGRKGRPVLLATMEVPFDETAAAFAADLGPDRVVQTLAQIELDGVDGQLAGFDFGEVENVVDDPQERVT